MDDREKIIKKFKLFSTVSMILGVLTVFFAVMYAFNGWSMIPVLVVVVITILVNGLARTYKEALEQPTDYGDPTEK